MKNILQVINEQRQRRQEEQRRLLLEEHRKLEQIRKLEEEVRKKIEEQKKYETNKVFSILHPVQAKQNKAEQEKLQEEVIKLQAEIKKLRTEYLNKSSRENSKNNKSNWLLYGVLGTAVFAVCIMAVLRGDSEPGLPVENSSNSTVIAEEYSAGVEFAREIFEESESEMIETVPEDTGSTQPELKQTETESVELEQTETESAEPEQPKSVETESEQMKPVETEPEQTKPVETESEPIKSIETGLEQTETMQPESAEAENVYVIPDLEKSVAQEYASAENNSGDKVSRSGTSDGSNSVVIPLTEDTQGDLVWVPTNGGKKYHSNSYCSNMKAPMQVTREHAEANGYTPCKKCY